MPLFRLLALSLLIAVALFLVRSVRKRLTHKPTSSDDNPPPANQDMVACHRCGLHIPKSEAIAKQNHYFCCREHSE